MTKGIADNKYYEARPSWAKSLTFVGDEQKNLFSINGGLMTVFSFIFIFS